MKKSGVFLLSIGDELLDGRTQNTNASWFGEKLRENGIPVCEVRCVSDTLTDIVATLKSAEKYPVVISTGGLGPTNDDRTLEGVAKAFRLPLGQTKASLAHVKERYQARGLPLTSQRLRLAQIPKGSKVLSNPTGTAPGVLVKRKNSDLYFLPGPPNECRRIFEEQILPSILKKSREKILLHREGWRTFGKGESDIYQRVETVIKALEEKYPLTITMGVHITFPCIDLTLEVWKIKGEKSPPKEEIEWAISSITETLGSLCFSRKREPLVEAVSRILQEKKLTVSTAESCTGGLLGKLFTDIPGSSAYYFGGVISYHNDLKKKLVGVSPSTLMKWGAVSESTVKEMADSLRKQTGTDYCLSLSGVSGPGGGSAEKPVGTIWVALSGPQGTKTLHQQILNGKGSRDQNRMIAAHLALDLLRAELS